MGHRPVRGHGSDILPRRVRVGCVRTREQELPSMFEFPVLVGDIGGTNARFGIIEKAGDQPRLLAHEATADHPDPSSAIRASLAKGGGPAPRSAILAIAG